MEQPLCSDHDSVSRCPSGCRLHGLILQHEARLENRLRNVCTASGAIRAAADNSMKTTAQIYHRSRAALAHATASQAEFVDAAEALSKKLKLLRKRSESLEMQGAELRSKVGQQLDELLRVEVQVAQQLCSCGGSCSTAHTFPVSLEDFAALRSEMEQMTPHAAAPGSVPVIHAVAADFGPKPLPVYKSIRAVLSEGLDLLEDLRPPRLLLQDE